MDTTMVTVTIVVDNFVRFISAMISSQPHQARVPSPGEAFVEMAILALKGLVPMVWLRSKTSPVEFLVGGAALLVMVLAVSHLHTAEPSKPSSAEGGKIKGILLKAPKPRHAYKPRVAFDPTLDTGNKVLKRSHDVCGDGGMM
ncbi:hypothetical protein QC761_501505 [Podospora bellae-mahoneyi]|uniref:Uncharacterized protein n=1 Tax=Podospora bellae-mahoneyi TaxID=2093777 RepID=A0ABR0FDV2_9PEZI|nr:hypothetical protein QC761_501505 [Podospora bellae-mahoneyi]